MYTRGQCLNAVNSLALVQKILKVTIHEFLCSSIRAPEILFEKVGRKSQEHLMVIS